MNKLIKELIEDLRGCDRVHLATKTGLGMGTIAKFLSGKNPNPTIKTVTLLRNYADKYGEKNDN